MRSIPLRKPATGPWYREPWPWILMSGPALVVVAGFVTLSFALMSQDGLVVDDYYKQGKAINQSLRRDQAAQQLLLRAWVDIDQVRDRVEVDVAGDGAALVDSQLKLIFIHATRSGLDRNIALRREAGRYVGTLPALPAGKWHVLLEDGAKKWRLQHDITVGALPVPRTLMIPAV